MWFNYEIKPLKKAALFISGELNYILRLNWLLIYIFQLKMVPKTTNYLL